MEIRMTGERKHVSQDGTTKDWTHVISLTCGMRALSSHERQRATEKTHKEHVILYDKKDEAGIARNEHIS